MKSTPWLSILVPVFNVHPYLEECVASITGQIEDGVELIFLDDASTDGSLALLEEMQASMPGTFEIARHAENRGLSGARNSLLEMAQGRYVWFIDSDDCLMPGAVQALKSIVLPCDPDIVLCDFKVLREKTQLKHRLRGELHRHTFEGPARIKQTTGGELLRGVLEPGHLHTWSKISKRSLWGQDLRFPEGRYFEDIYTTPPLLMRSNSYYYEPSVWIAYRRREGSILSEMSLQKMDDMSAAISSFCKDFSGSPLRDDEKARFALSYFSARSFIGIARQLNRKHYAEQLEDKARHRSSFLDSIPMSLQEMRAAYFKRNWFLRWARLNYWVNNKSLQPCAAEKGTS